MGSGKLGGGVRWWSEEEYVPNALGETGISRLYPTSTGGRGVVMTAVGLGAMRTRLSSERNVLCRSGLEWMEFGRGTLECPLSLSDR